MNEKRVNSIRAIIGPSFFSGVVKAASGIVMLLILMLLGRSGGPELVGLYSLALSLIQWLSLLACFGLPIYLMRHVSASFNAVIDRQNKIPKDYSYSIIIILLIGSIVSISIYLLGGYISETVFKNGQFEDGILWIAIVIIPSAILILNSEAIRGAQSPVTSQSLQSLLIPSMVLIFSAMVMLVFKKNINYSYLMMAYTAATFFSLIISYYILGIRYGKLHKPIYEREIGIPGLVGAVYGTAKSGSVFLVNGLAQIVLAVMDIIMLGILSSTSEVGVYASASRLSGAVLLVAASVNNVSAPRLSRAYNSGNMGDFSRCISSSLTITIIPSLILAITLYVWGSYILGVFGNEFIGGIGTMRILVISAVIQFLTGPVGWVLSMANKEKQFQSILLIGVTINLVLNAILIPIYGAVGAAIATAVSTVYTGFHASLVSYQQLGVYTVYGMQYMMQKLFK